MHNRDSEKHTIMDGQINILCSERNLMKIAVYLGSNPGKNPEFRRKTEELGHWIGENGHTLVYGGAKWGLMGILADAVTKKGGKIIGVIPGFIAAKGVVYTQADEMEYTDSLSARKARMLELADAYVAMPGGVGTLEEISEAISQSRLGRSEKECFLYDVDGYYDDLRRMLLKMIDQGFLQPSELTHVHFVESMEEIAEVLNCEEETAREKTS